MIDRDSEQTSRLSAAVFVVGVEQGAVVEARGPRACAAKRCSVGVAHHIERMKLTRCIGLDRARVRFGTNPESPKVQDAGSLNPSNATSTLAQPTRGVENWFLYAIKDPRLSCGASEKAARNA